MTRLSLCTPQGEDCATKTPLSVLLARTTQFSPLNGAPALASGALAWAMLIMRTQKIATRKCLSMVLSSFVDDSNLPSLVLRLAPDHRTPKTECSTKLHDSQ